MDPMTAQIDELVADREKFSRFVYTPLDEALEELKKRQTDPTLHEFIQKELPVGAPLPMLTNPKAVMFRQVVTPNYEIRRFLDLIDMVEGLSPMFLEYAEDKFTDNNEWKYSLGKVGFYFGQGKKGGEKIERTRVIDFNSYRGKKLAEVKTLWGQSLIDFHHELFLEAYGGGTLNNDSFFDGSDWFSQSGGQAIDYYKNFLALFVKNGVLFENFLLDTKEIDFTKNVFLPAFIKITQESGVKPLIVALEPTEIESAEFWMCHPAASLSFVNKKMGL